MARKARVQFEGAIYHAFNRGIDRRLLFWDATDYETFLDCLELGVERFGVRVYAYGLMPNHFHLLVETPLGNLSGFLQGVQTRYAGYFNRRHRKSGYVYEGPYKAKLVEGDEYLLRLSRYVHLNPVDTQEMKDLPPGEVVKELRAYPWSSFREYCGKAPRKSWMDYGPVGEQVKERMGGRRGAYRRYVESGLADNDEELLALVNSSRVCLGSEEFNKDLQKRLQRRTGVRPGRDSLFRHQGRFADSAGIMKAICEGLKIEESALKQRRGCAWMRGVAAEMLCRFGGLTQVEAARRLGLTSGAAVCIRRNELRVARRQDRGLDVVLRKIEAILEKAPTALL